MTGSGRIPWREWSGEVSAHKPVGQPRGPGTSAGPLHLLQQDAPFTAPSSILLRVHSKPGGFWRDHATGRNEARAETMRRQGKDHAEKASTGIKCGSPAAMD